MRISIPKHLQPKVMELMEEMGTADATVVLTHALNCYFFGGGRGQQLPQHSPAQPAPPPEKADEFDASDFAALQDFGD